MTEEPGVDATTARLNEAAATWVSSQTAAFDTVRNATEIPRSDVDVAEGYRWVTRLVSLVQEWFIEKADPLHPQVFQLQDEYRKLLVDNPDVHYVFAVLDDQRSYWLTGTRGDAAYVGLTFGTPIGKGEVNGRTGTLIQVHLDEFELGPSGEFSILLAPPAVVAAMAPEDRPANVIELVPGTAQMAVRETYFDKAHDELSTFHMALIGEAPLPVLEGNELADRMEFAGIFLQFVAATAVNMWHDTAHNINQFGGVAGSEHVAAQDDEVRSHSNAEMTYHGGRFVLGEGEALKVTVHKPENDFLYWGLTTASPWMESYDYRYTTTALNNQNAVTTENDDWELIISPTDPGHPNWLNTGGRREGYMLVRWVLADGPPHPTAEVISIT